MPIQTTAWKFKYTKSQIVLRHNFTFLYPLNCPCSNSTHQTIFRLGFGFYCREKIIILMFPRTQRPRFSVWANKLAPRISFYTYISSWWLRMNLPTDLVSKPTMLWARVLFGKFTEVRPAMQGNPLGDHRQPFPHNACPTLTLRCLANCESFAPRCLWAELT